VLGPLDRRLLPIPRRSPPVLAGHHPIPAG
jgi:hypothetical protein